MIIDSHVHVDEVKPLGWIDPPEVMLRLLDEAGIDRAIIMTYTDVPGVNPRGLEYTADVVARYPDRFWGYARMHPWYGQEAVQLFERAIREYRLRGLKLHPVSSLAHPGDETTTLLIRKAAELKVPVLFHSGDEPLCTPFEIEYAAAACPEANIILGHMGGYFHVSQAIEVAARRPNVYLDTSAMPYPTWIRRAVDQVGPEKILFASDGPGCDPKLELYKVRRAGLSAGEEEMLFSANILRLLGA